MRLRLSGAKLRTTSWRAVGSRHPVRRRPIADDRTGQPPVPRDSRTSAATCPSRWSRRRRRPACSRTPTTSWSRNVMVSPLSGLSGGLADLRPVARAFDDGCAPTPERLAACPGGSWSYSTTGTVTSRDARSTSARWQSMTSTPSSAPGADGWGRDRPHRRPGTARRAGARVPGRRGDGPTAAWHVDELGTPGCSPGPATDAPCATPARSRSALRRRRAPRGGRRRDHSPTSSGAGATWRPTTCSSSHPGADSSSPIHLT